jgi:ABC-2 type transport system permease protein
LIIEKTAVIAAAARDESTPHVRQFGAVNWLGLWTLYRREVHRFLKVWMQTVVAPVVTTLLFLAIFLLALAGQRAAVGGTPFAQFVAPGLIMMAMMQNAFANTTSSLMIAKIQGNISDLLMPPLSPAELVLGIAMGGVTRGLAVGLAVGIAMACAVPIAIADPALILFNAVAASLLLSVLGILAALWAEKFDHIAAVTNFLVMPLSFLSGTFYSIERLPPPFHLIAELNPFFYMIDGFRAGFTGHADGSTLTGIVLLTTLNVALLALAYHLFQRGYKLKT